MKKTFSIFAFCLLFPMLVLSDSIVFSVDSAAPFTLHADEGRTLAFEAPEVLEIDEERTAPANWDAAWADFEVWPSDGKGKGAWSLFPRYDEDGSIILGGAFRQLVPGSVKITSSDGATAFQEGTDYRVNQEWGFVANVDNRLGVPGTVTLRFQAKLALQRIDLVQKDAEGRLSVKKGESRRISPMIPDPDAGCTAVAGVYLAPWQRDGAWKILPEDIFPIDAEKAKPVELVRPEAVAKTLEKLREGTPVTIAFIGDSLTLGAEAGQWWSDDSTTWRGRVMRGLKARFPASEITELPAFQGGRGIAFGLEVVKETVLPAKPDLAFVMLGVNDCHKGISAPGPTTPVDAFRKGFDSLIAQCQESGMDVVVLSSMETNPFDANGDAVRWADYRAAIRAVSDARGTAYGDTYEQWQRLRYRGIPPFSQLHNWINHPGSWGHGLFADVALRFFPE